MFKKLFLFENIFYRETEFWFLSHCYELFLFSKNFRSTGLLCTATELTFLKLSSHKLSWNKILTEGNSVIEIKVKVKKRR